MHQHDRVNRIVIDDDLYIERCECGEVFANGTQITHPSTIKLIKALYGLIGKVNKSLPANAANAMDVVDRYSEKYGSSQDILLEVFRICMQSSR